MNDWLHVKDAAEIFGLNPSTLNGHHHRFVLSKVIRRKRVKVGKGATPKFWNRADCEAVMKVHQERGVSLIDAARIINGEPTTAERKEAARRKYRQKKRFEKSIGLQVAMWKRPEGIDEMLEELRA